MAPVPPELLPPIPELTPAQRELLFMSVGDMARRWGISRSTASARRSRWLAFYYEALDGRRTAEAEWRVAERQLRHAAHLDVRRAVRAGDLVPPNACEECGITVEALRAEAYFITDPRLPGLVFHQLYDDWTPERLALQAHHPDVRRPLDVVWLCPRCHGRADNPSTRTSRTR